jgi:hypothetical protein
MVHCWPGLGCAIGGTAILDINALRDAPHYLCTDHRDRVGWHDVGGGARRQCARRDQYACRNPEHPKESGHSCRF